MRYELYDPNVDNSDDKAEGTIGIAYHIIPWMSQIKIQVRRHDYQNDAKEDYNVWGAGVAIGF